MLEEVQRVQCPLSSMEISVLFRMVGSVICRMLFLARGWVDSKGDSSELDIFGSGPGLVHFGGFCLFFSGREGLVMAEVGFLRNFPCSIVTVGFLWSWLWVVEGMC